MAADSSGSKKKTTAKKATKSTAKKATKSTTKKATKSTAKKSVSKPTAAKKVAKKTTKKAAAPRSKPTADSAREATAGSTRPKTKQVKTGIKLRVRQIRSGIGHRRDFRDTLRALGVKHHQDEVVVTQNRAIDGMLRKVRHLIRVTPEE